MLDILVPRALLLPTGRLETTRSHRHHANMGDTEHHGRQTASMSALMRSTPRHTFCNLFTITATPTRTSQTSKAPSTRITERLQMEDLCHGKGTETLKGHNWLYTAACLASQYSPHLCHTHGFPQISLWPCERLACYLGRPCHALWEKHFCLTHLMTREQRSQRACLHNSPPLRGASPNPSAIGSLLPTTINPLGVIPQARGPRSTQVTNHNTSTWTTKALSSLGS